MQVKYQKIYHNIKEHEEIMANYSDNFSNAKTRFKNMNEGDLPKGEKPPNGREWSNTEQDEYYRNLRKNISWTEWYLKALEGLNENKKINYKEGVTNRMVESMNNAYKGGSTVSDFVNNYKN